MIPIDKLAALSTLKAGLDAVIPEARKEVLAYRKQTRGKAFTTDLGEVTFRGNPASISYNEGRLLAWAEKYMPHEVEPEHTVTVPATVRATLYKTLETRLSIEGDDVVDKETGEIVDFATVVPGKDDTPVFTPTPEAKRDAARVVRERVEQIAAVVMPELEA